MYRALSIPLIALLLQAWAAPAALAQTNDARLITVTASADVRATPDRALAQFGVETQASTAQEAMAQNNQIMQRVVAALMQAGIPSTNLQTSAINLTPIFTKPPRQEDPPRLVGFRASNIVTAVMTDLTRVGAVIDAAVGAGANQVHGITFRLSDDLPFRLEALRLAAERARAKAAALAIGLGLTLGPVESASEVGFQVTPVSERAGLDASTPVLPGQVVIHVDVQVRYRIGA